MLEYLLQIFKYALSGANPQNHGSNQLTQTSFDLYSNQMGEYANSGSPSFSTPAILLDFRESSFTYQRKGFHHQSEVSIALYIISKLRDKNQTWPSAQYHSRLMDEVLSSLNNFTWKNLPEQLPKGYERLEELSQKYKLYNLENDIKIEATTSKEWEYANTRINILHIKGNVDIFNPKMKIEQMPWTEKNYETGNIISQIIDGKLELFRATRSIRKGETFERQLMYGYWEKVNERQNNLNTSLI